MPKMKISNIAKGADFTKTDKPIRQKTEHFELGRKKLSEVWDNKNLKVISASTDDCALWPYNERQQGGLNEEVCHSIKEDIQKNGQIQPAVARLDPTGNKKYEILIGTRRFWACSRLPQKKIDLVIIEANDKHAYHLMRSENKERDDTTAYEKAFNAKLVIADLYEGNQKAYCLDNDIAEATFSSWMSLANMEEEILKAFPNKMEISITQAVNLRSAMGKNAKAKKAMIAQACKLSATAISMTTAQVYADLMKAGKGALATKVIHPIVKNYVVAGDKKGVQIKQSTTGAIVIKVSKQVSTNKKEVLKAITAFLGNNP